MAKIHFLNVGHGDCTIIEHNNGNLTVIDINNGSHDMDDKSVEEIANAAGLDQSLKLWKLNLLTEEELLKKAGYAVTLTNPIAFLQEHYEDKPIFRYIQTHPDFDHLRGLASIRDNFETLNFWDLTHAKEWDGNEHQTGDKANWEAYQEFRAEKHCRVMHLYRDMKGKYFNQDDSGTGGNGLHILSPTPVLVANCNEIEDWNNMSYVLEYRVDNRRIIFGGDAEDTAWENILGAYGENGLKCDVLKASHHGRDSGYHQKAVKAMSPEYTIVSVGKKPDTDAHNKYKQYSDNVWSTRWKGDITLEIINNEMAWSCSQNQDEYAY